ncbi:MAG: hypothetical protein AVDCRST_MAG03-3896, partial [uncultured Rubrobacteraceae bacterium]
EVAASVGDPAEHRGRCDLHPLSRRRVRPGTNTV